MPPAGVMGEVYCFPHLPTNFQLYYVGRISFKGSLRVHSEIDSVCLKIFILSSLSSRLSWLPWKPLLLHITAS